MKNPLLCNILIFEKKNTQAVSNNNQHAEFIYSTISFGNCECKFIKKFETNAKFLLKSTLQTDHSAFAPFYSPFSKGDLFFLKDEWGLERISSPSPKDKTPFFEGCFTLSMGEWGFAVYFLTQIFIALQK
jgi:hypothetical protein